jgi:demethoxyubiquinone hydroxylase (CLK1/Coq7/Cat5 family)
VQAGEEETDHLIWCKKRLEELNGKPSIPQPCLVCRIICHRCNIWKLWRKN